MKDYASKLFVVEEKHTAATALGKKVLCKVKLVQQEKRVLVFQFEATVEEADCFGHS